MKQIRIMQLGARAWRLRSWALVLCIWLIPTLLQAADFYWVGDSGNWNDAAEWAAVSGGTGGTGPGAGVPGAGDNVFFDANSFSTTGLTVSLTAAASCTNVDWSGTTNSPTLSLGASSLSVSGNWVHQNGVTITAASAAGRVVLTNGATASISSNSGAAATVEFPNLLKTSSAQTDFNCTLAIAAGGTLVASVGAAIVANGRLQLGNSASFTHSGASFTANDSFITGTNCSVSFLTATGVTLLGSVTMGAGSSLGGTNDITFGNGTLGGGNAYSISLQEVSPALSGVVFSFQHDGTTSISSLSLAEGAVLELSTGGLTTLTALNLPVDCSSTNTPSELRSSGAPNAGAAQIDFSSTKQEVRLRVTNVDASPGATLNVYGNDLVFDGGGNTNVFFEGDVGLASRSLYWIGGVTSEPGVNTNWNNTANWSLTPGGSGGHCEPSTTDDVIFDNSSFPTGVAADNEVTLVGDAFARSVTWAGAYLNTPSFTSEVGETLFVYDNLSIGAGVDMDRTNFLGTVAMVNDGTAATQSSTLTINSTNGGGGPRDFGNLTIDGASEVVTLTGSAFRQLGTLTLANGGTFNLGSQAYNCGGDISIPTTGFFQGTASSTLSFFGDGALTSDPVFAAGARQVGTLEMNRTNFTLTLGSPLQVASSLVLTEGLIQSTSLNTLTMGAAASVSGASGYASGATDASHVLGPLAKVFADGATAGPFMAPIGFGTAVREAGLVSATVTAGPETMTFEYFNTPFGDLSIGAGTMDTVSQVEYWDITAAGTSGGITATVVLTYDRFISETGNDATKRANTRVAYYNGVDWVSLGIDAGNSDVSNVRGYVQANTPSSTFSPFTLGTDDSVSNPLPVELASFEADVVARGVQLSWTTLSELNNDFFAVERSVDGVSFTELTQVPGQGTTNATTGYQYLDASARHGTFYYRLRQVDYDGTFAYSPVVLARLGPPARLSVFPVPARCGHTFSVLLEPGYAEALLVSSQGAVVQQWALQSSSAMHSLQLGPGVAPGVYVLRLSGPAGVRQSRLAISP